MSARGVLRSFCEARSPDEEPIREGITYGTARALQAEIQALEARIDVLEQRLRYVFSDKDWLERNS
jgi:hypothetical protein